MHVRINEREANPNPHINWITALPGHGNENDARELLRVLAAQVKPLMKRHGFTINSFEEVCSLRIVSLRGNYFAVRT